MEGPLVDLGGCEGCGLGCAVACASQRPGAEVEARRSLAATGVALAVLGVVPALVTSGWWRPFAAMVAAAGVAVAALALVALRAGRPGGDLPARWGYRLVPATVAGMLVAWTAAAVRSIMG